MKSSARITDNDWTDSSLKGPYSCYQIAAYWIAPPSWPRRVCCDFFPNLCNAFRSTKACCSIVALLVMTYLVIMDIILYSYFRRANLVHDSKKGRSDELYSPFTHLSVKALMSDEPSQFLKTPSAEYFNSVTRFSSVFPFISANAISVSHLIVGFLAGKFIASSNLNDRRIGVALFCFRSWLDALDGTVFRAHSGRLEFRSHPSTTGYFIDASFDTLGGFFLCFGILFHLIKRFGPKKYHLLPLWSRSSNSPASAALLVDNNACGTSADSMETVPETGDAYAGGEETYSVAYLFSKALALGICLGMSGMGWNYTMQSLTDIFQTELKDENLSMLQHHYCHSFTTTIIFMAWRLLGSMAILNYILLATFFNWIWELLKGPHVVLLCLNLVLLALSEIHIRHLRSVLQL